MWTPAICTIALLFQAFAAAAEEAPALGYLNWVRDQLSFVTAEAAVPDEEAAAEEPVWVGWLRERLGVEDGALAENAGRVEGELMLMRQEVANLKETVRQLQDTLDLYIGRLLAEVEAENEALRQEVRRLYALAGGEDALPPAVPRPGGQALDQVLQQMAQEAPLNVPPEVIEQTAPLPEAAPAAEESPLPPVDFSFTVVSEWGRDPEQVEGLPGDVASLKGIVGLVPPGSSEEDLIALGRDLRLQYAAYDNLNIEIFDDPEAAQSYAERSATGNPDARVLSVSKHKASGRDVILLVNTEGGTREVPAL